MTPSSHHRHLILATRSLTLLLGLNLLKFRQSAFATSTTGVELIGGSILNVAMKVRRPSYNVVLELHGRLLVMSSDKTWERV